MVKETTSSILKALQGKERSPEKIAKIHKYCNSKIKTLARQCPKELRNDIHVREMLTSGTEDSVKKVIKKYIPDVSGGSIGYITIGNIAYVATFALALYAKLKNHLPQNKLLRWILHICFYIYTAYFLYGLIQTYKNTRSIEIIRKSVDDDKSKIDKFVAQTQQTAVDLKKQTPIETQSPSSSSSSSVSSSSSSSVSSSSSASRASKKIIMRPTFPGMSEIHISFPLPPSPPSLPPPTSTMSSSSSGTKSGGQVQEDEKGTTCTNLIVIFAIIICILLVVTTIILFCIGTTSLYKLPTKPAFMCYEIPEAR